MAELKAQNIYDSVVIATQRGRSVGSHLPSVPRVCGSGFPAAVWVDSNSKPNMSEPFEPCRFGCLGLQECDSTPSPKPRGTRTLPGPSRPTAMLVPTMDGPVSSCFGKVCKSGSGGRRLTRQANHLQKVNRAWHGEHVRSASSTWCQSTAGQRVLLTGQAGFRIMLGLLGMRESRCFSPKLGLTYLC